MSAEIRTYGELSGELKHAFAEGLLECVTPDDLFTFKELVECKGTVFARVDEPRVVRRWLAEQGIIAGRGGKTRVVIIEDDPCYVYALSKSAVREWQKIEAQAMALIQAQERERAMLESVKVAKDRKKHQQHKAEKKKAEKEKAAKAKVHKKEQVAKAMAHQKEQAAKKTTKVMVVSRSVEPVKVAAVRMRESEVGSASKRAYNARPEARESRKHYMDRKRREAGARIRALTGVPRFREDAVGNKPIPLEVYVITLYVLTGGKRFSYSKPPAYPFRKDAKSLRTLLRKLRDENYVSITGSEGRQKVEWLKKAQSCSSHVVGNPIKLNALIAEYTPRRSVKLSVEVRARILYVLSGGKNFELFEPSMHIHLAGRLTLSSFIDFIREIVKRGWVSVEDEVVCWSPEGIALLSTSCMKKEVQGFNGLFSNVFNQFMLVRILYELAGFEYVLNTMLRTELCRRFGIDEPPLNHFGRALSGNGLGKYVEKRSHKTNGRKATTITEYRVTPAGLSFAFLFEDVAELEALRELEGV